MNGKSHAPVINVKVSKTLILMKKKSLERSSDKEFLLQEDVQNYVKDFTNNNVSAVNECEIKIIDSNSYF